MLPLLFALALDLPKPTIAVTAGNGASGAQVTVGAVVIARTFRFWNDTVTPADETTAGGNVWQWGSSGGGDASTAPVELGQRIKVVGGGQLTQLHFFKRPGSGGPHVAHVWDSVGTKLAEATFATETASGWQTVTLGPVTLASNTEYRISVYFPAGAIIFDEGAFSVVDRTNGPVVMPHVGNGVYVYGVGGGFPSNNSANNTYYWIDATIQSAATGWTQSIFDYEVPITEQTDPNPYTLGIVFQSAIDVKVTGVRFWQYLANSGAHIGLLYANNGTELGRVTFPAGDVNNTWRIASFGAPIPITAGVPYIIAYTTPNGHYAAVGSGYFSAKSKVDGLLSSPKASLTTNGNGVFDSSGVLPTFPTGTFGSNNYLVDVIVGP